MFCPQCGGSVKDGAKFCEACGAPMAAAAPPPPAPAVRPSPAPAMSDPFDTSASSVRSAASHNSQALMVPAVIIVLVVVAGLALWIRHKRQEPGPATPTQVEQVASPVEEPVPYEPPPVSDEPASPSGSIPYEPMPD